VGKEQQEINLLEIWQVIVEQKRVVFITWMLCVGLGLAYVLLVTPVYKAEVFMLPPSQSDIQPLNISVLAFPDRSGRSDRSDFLEYDSESVYRLFVQTLKSRAVRRDFYEENKLATKLGYNEANDPDVFFEQYFNQKLSVAQNVKKLEEKFFVTLSFENKDPSLVAMLVNDFVNKVTNTVAIRLVNEVNVKVASLKAGVEESIRGKKMIAKIRRDDRIVALQEALSISAHSGENTQQLNLNQLAVSTQELPLHMINQHVLQAEIEALKVRKDDAPFIEGLRDLEEVLASLEQVSIDQSEVKPVFIDQKAWKPRDPIKPKKTLIVILASLLGLLLGLVIAIGSYPVRKRREG